MSFLLDTSTCVALLRPKPSLVRARADRALSRRERMVLSSVVLHELWYGVYKSERVAENTRKLQSFLAGLDEIYQFDETDAHTAGEIRAQLESVGNVIGAYDTLIAAQCLNRDFILVTSNVSEFRRVKGLRWVDWAK